MAPIFKILFLALPLFAVVACRGDGVAVVDIEKLIHQNLKLADPDAKIVKFFEQNKFPYSFDQFNQRYQAAVPSSRKRNFIGVESAIEIYIAVDKNRSFLSARVEKSYTYL
jgi:hypothetical protein